MIYLHATLTAFSLGCVVAIVWIINRTDKAMGELRGEVQRLHHELRETWATTRKPKGGSRDDL